MKARKFDPAGRRIAPAKGYLRTRAIRVAEADTGASLERASSQFERGETFGFEEVYRSRKEEGVRLLRHADTAAGTAEPYSRDKPAMTRLITPIFLRPDLARVGGNLSLFNFAAV